MGYATIQGKVPGSGRPPLDIETADKVVVEALVEGHHFWYQLAAERRAAARELIRLRPDLTRQEVADRVGVSDRTVYRMIKEEMEREPPREAVVEALMAGKRRGALDPTVAETFEACRRMILAGATDGHIKARLNCNPYVVSRARRRIRESGL